MLSPAVAPFYEGERRMSLASVIAGGEISLRRNSDTAWIRRVERESTTH